MDFLEILKNVRVSVWFHLKIHNWKSKLLLNKPYILRILCKKHLFLEIQQQSFDLVVTIVVDLETRMYFFISVEALLNNVES